MKTKKFVGLKALTKTGLQGLIKATIAVFFQNVAYMLPIGLLIYFSQTLLVDFSTKSPLVYILVILLIAFIMYVFVDISYNSTYTATYQEAANLRIDIAKLMKDLPLSYFSKHDISDLSQTVMQDVSDIEHALSHAIPQTIGLVAFLIIITFMMMFHNIGFALAISVPIFTSFLLLVLSKNLQKRATAKYFYALRENSDSFQQAIEMHQEIKSFGQKTNVKDDILKKIDSSEKIHLVAEISQVIPVSLSGSILKLCIGLTLIVGVTIVNFKNPLEIVYFLGYILASLKLSDAVFVLITNIAEIMYIDVRLNRIADLRNTETQSGVPYELKNFNVEFKDVSFGYDKNHKVIDGISFIAEQNKVTALVGPSGCGKTTVLRLMSRLYDYDTGKIFIDGKDIKDIATDSLFEKVSIVFQDVMLFNTSVMENIRIGNKNATDAEVVDAAKLAGCHEFVQSLPEKYATLIGENGSKLSGGERQRISIARAFLKNAPIIILDEISAALDVGNEMLIQESLNKLLKGKTVIIISHRLKSIENADKIIVMNKGKIEAEGSHIELLKSSKLYSRLIEKSKVTEDYEY